MFRHVFWIIASTLCIAVRAEDAPPPLVITHAVLWTPQGMQPDRELLIRDGRVAEIGASDKLTRPEGARVLDAGGDTLLPGLIDLHIHLVHGGRLPKDFPAHDVFDATSRQLLRSGVTSGRIHLWDLPSLTTFRKEHADERSPAPRLVYGGPALFGGRPTWEAPTANVWGVKGASDAAQKVRRLRESGADWVALHDLEKFLPGELDVIISEAREVGLRLMAGGDRFSEIERAADLGVESIEYLDRSEVLRYPDKLLAKLKARKTSLTMVPMIGFPHRFIAYRRGAMSLEPSYLTEFYPPAAGAFITSALREDQTREIPNAPKWSDVPAPLPGKFRQLRDAGLQVAVGTDCGSPGHLQADAIWWELETWRKLGVPPIDIVRAATIVPAALLKQTDVGHLGLGARGDFVRGIL